jgi:hypothetical protein
VTQDILHMNTTDPLRTPSFTLFGNADYFFQASCANGSNPDQAGCPVVGPRFAWNHGDDNPEIARTWAGIVGPGVKPLGQTGAVWTDHTDLRPTMLSLLGLSDDYADDGNLVAQVVNDGSLPPAVLAHRAAYEELQGRLKQLNAPFGQFGHDAEVVSTTAVAGDDRTYNGFASQLAGCNAQRDALAASIQATLGDAVFHHGSLDDKQMAKLADRADALIANMHSLSLMAVPPRQSVCRSGGHTAGGPPARGSDAVTFANSRAGETRFVLRRAGRLVATGHAARAGTVTLHARRALAHGRYTLVIARLDHGRPHTVSERNVHL